MQDIQRFRELFGVYPAKLILRHLTMREVAEIAGRITGVGHSDITQRRTAAADQLCYVPGLCESIFRVKEGLNWTP